ncbi:hypothetical protein C5142_16340 [Rhodococcus sp. BGS-1C]|uniref:hypothetical protein n=1 Tax=Rhodococcus sp. BGS-1C TaxID=2100132 RepID=UPI003DA1A615
MLELRVDTLRLTGEFVWLSAEHLDAEDAVAVLREARDRMVTFGGALGLAADTARLALAHTDHVT